MGNQFHIQSLDRSHGVQIQNKIDQKTKPPGSLGRLESLAHQLALILGKDQIELRRPVMLVFAGDHGIAEAGVSIAPSAVTRQMVLNFLDGGAAINCFCRLNNIEVNVVDAGIILPLEDPRLTVQPLGNGTADFSQGPAMSLAQVEQGLDAGRQVLGKHYELGSNVVGLGEMGIGNTSSAAAIMASVLEISAEQCAGRGTGIDDATLLKKISLINKALGLHKNNLDDPVNILANLGGFEIVQMTGAILAAAEKKMVILIDGFIATAAALVADQIDHKIRDYLVFCHQSDEQGHGKMLQHFKATPLLSMGLRLGEGTGAALAYPLLQAAADFYNNMASFETAGVDAV